MASVYEHDEFADRAPANSIIQRVPDLSRFGQQTSFAVFLHTIEFYNEETKLAVPKDKADAVIVCFKEFEREPSIENR